MPTQEEKVTVLEENITILLGIASGKERERSRVFKLE